MKHASQSTCLWAFITAFSFFISAPQAHARPDARKMTCEQAQKMVKKHGEVVMTTGQHTYFRFVATLGYCDRGEALFPKRSATKDNPQCVIGYECREPLFSNWDD